MKDKVIYFKNFNEFVNESKKTKTKTKINFEFSEGDLGDNLYYITAYDQDDNELGYIWAAYISSEELTMKLEDYYSDEKAHKLGYNTLKEEDFVYLDKLVVKRKYQKQGIGDKLMKEFIKFFNKKGYKEFFLKAMPGPDSLSLNKLISFYKGFGFKVLDTVKDEGDKITLMYKK